MTMSIITMGVGTVLFSDAFGGRSMQTIGIACGKRFREEVLDVFDNPTDIKLVYNVISKQVCLTKIEIEGF